MKALGAGVVVSLRLKSKWENLEAGLGARWGNFQDLTQNLKLWHPRVGKVGHSDPERQRA